MTSPRSRSDRLRHARSASATRSAYGAVVGLRIVGSPDEPFGAELADEPVDDLARVAMLVGRLEHMRGDLEVQVGVLGETEERGGLRVRRATVELDEAAVVEHHRLLGKLLEDALEPRQVLGKARNHHAEAERRAHLPQLERDRMVEPCRLGVLQRADREQSHAGERGLARRGRSASPATSGSSASTIAMLTKRSGWAAAESTTYELS